jgi:hypothetical protein
VIALYRVIRGLASVDESDRCKRIGGDDAKLELED